MNISELHTVAERFKQGLLAVATDGNYDNNEYMSDLKLLIGDKKIAKLLPFSIVLIILLKFNFIIHPYKSMIASIHISTSLVLSSTLLYLRHFHFLPRILSVK